MNVVTRPGTPTPLEAIQHPMRVAVVTNMWPHPSRPAFGIFVRDQVESLRRVPGLMVEVFPLEPIERRGRYLSGRAVADAVVSGAFDVIHVHHPFTMLALAPFGRSLRRVPIVLTIHGIEGTEGWRRRVTSAVVRMADHLVVTNQPLHRIYGGQVIPCGVDERRFTPGPPWDGRRPVATITVGEDRPEKQFWLASAAVDWARPAENGKGFTHRFVSDVAPERMPDVYREAQVLLLASRAEGSPMVIQEALASGLRVVATDVGDVRSIGGPGRGLHVADDQTPRALGLRLLEALSAIRARTAFEPRFVRLADTAARLHGLYRSAARAAMAGNS